MNRRTTEYNDLRVLIDTRINQVLGRLGRAGVAGGGTETPVSSMQFGAPTVPVRLAFAPGSATTALRSDAQLALDQSIAPTWTGTHAFNAQVTFNGAIRSGNYASQTTGWAITGAGEADFRYLFVDEMHAKAFIADLEQALAGGQIISKSVAVLAQPFTAPAAGGTATLWVRDLPSAPNMAAFQSGDVVRLRTFSRAGGSLTIADCWGTVTGYADGTGVNEGQQSWTFTRSSGSNAGAMPAGTVIQSDAIVLDYGTDGNGFYEVNAIDGVYGQNSPYAQIATWTGHPHTGTTVRGRFGHLRGIFGVANEFGLFVGEGTATTQKWLRISNAGAELHNIPLKMFNGTTQTVNIDSSGTNVWIGTSSSDKRLSWDGTTLKIVGDITVTRSNLYGGHNLIRNGSFEIDSNGDGLADHTNIYSNEGLAGVTASIVAGYVSPKAQRIAWTSNTITKGIYTLPIMRQAGVYYTLSVWVRCSAANNLVFQYNSAPSEFAWLTDSVIDTTWRRLTARFKWNTTVTDSWHLSITLGTMGSGGWIEFDDLIVTQSDGPQPWSPARDDAIAYNGFVNNGLAPTSAGLYLSYERVGHWDGSQWRTWMDNQGRFYFKGSSGATLEWTGTRLEGRNSSGTLQWYNDATSGQIMAGGGNIRLGANGAVLIGGTGFAATNAINFVSASDGTSRMGELYGYHTSTQHTVALRSYSNLGGREAWSYVSASNESGAQAWVGLDAHKFTSPNSIQNPRAAIYLMSHETFNQSTVTLYAITNQGTSSVTLDRTGGSATFNVSGATKNFVIPHPLDPDKELVHTTVESDGVRTLYCGIAETDARGYADVRLPDWFDALNARRVYSLMVESSLDQATVIRQTTCAFTIYGPPHARVHWMIVCDRHDPVALTSWFGPERPKRVHKIGSRMGGDVATGSAHEND